MTLYGALDFLVLMPPFSTNLNGEVDITTPASVAQEVCEPQRQREEALLPFESLPQSPTKRLWAPSALQSVPRKVGEILGL